MKKNFLLFLLVFFSWGQGLTKDLDLLESINPFDQNTNFKSYSYYKSFYSSLKLNKKNSDFNIFGIALSLPTSKDFNLEVEVFTGQTKDFLDKNTNIQLTHGYGTHLIGFYPLGQSLLLTGRYGWNKIYLKEKENNEIKKTEIEGDTYGYGLRVDLTKNISCSYERRLFHSESRKSDLFSIEIKF